MVKPILLLPVVGFAFRLVVLVMPLPLLAATPSPIASCTKPEVSALIDKLAKDGEEQKKAIVELSKCSDAAGSLIWELENSPNVQVRSALIDVLEQIGVPAADGLIEVLNNRSNPEVARSLAIEILADIAQAKKTESSEKVKIVQRLTERKVDLQESVLIRINADQALRQISNPISGIPIQEGSSVEQIKKWIEKNPKIPIGVLVGVGLVALYLLTLRLKPLWLLYLPAKIKFKIWGLDIDVPIVVLCWLKYRPRVLDQWVRERLEASKADFEKKEKQLELNKSEGLSPIYIPIPFSFEEQSFYDNNGKTGGEDLAASLKKEIFESKNCLVIVGEGGTGKSRLACQIARWSAGWETRFQTQIKPLYKYSMLPIFISQDLQIGSKPEEKPPLLTAILAQLPKTPAPEPNEELVKVLLKEQRLLVIIDRFSELSKDTQDQIKKEVQDSSINALVITSRLGESFSDRRSKQLKPSRLTGLNLAYFISQYLEQKGTLAHVKGDKNLVIETFWKNLRSQIDVELEDATVLLTRMYLDQVDEVLSNHSSNHSSEELTEELVENLTNKIVNSIPELMDAYLFRLNKAVQDKKSDENIKKYVQTIASTCLESNGYQPKAAPRDKIIKALVNLDKEDAINQNQKEDNALKCLEEYLDKKLKLLEISDSNKVKISLDPLAEYFAALQFVSNCNAPESEQKRKELWEKLISDIDESDNGKDRVKYLSEIKGFLKAVRKCCDSQEFQRNVPQFALNALDERIEPDGTKREERRQRKQVQRAIANLQDDDRKYRELAIADLKEMGVSAKPAVRYLLNILESRNEILELRQSALEVLQEIRPDSIQLSSTLISILENQNDAVELRRSVFEVLKEISPDSTQLSSTLISILENQNDAVELRRSALEVLQEISPDSTQLSSTLISILENQNDAVELRRSIIDVLGTLSGDKQTIELLFNIVKDGNEAGDVRLRAVYGLRQLGRKIPDLVAKIKEGNIQIHKLKSAPVVRIEDQVEGLKLEMVQIPAGSFWMGSPEDEKDGDNDERPQHEVTIAKPFWMGKYPVTQAQWRAVAALPPSNPERNLEPDPSNFANSNLKCITQEVALEGLMGIV